MSELKWRVIVYKYYSEQTAEFHPFVILICKTNIIVIMTF